MLYGLLIGLVLTAISILIVTQAKRAYTSTPLFLVIAAVALVLFTIEGSFLTRSIVQKRNAEKIVTVVEEAFEQSVDGKTKTRHISKTKNVAKNAVETGASRRLTSSIVWLILTFIVTTVLLYVTYNGRRSTLRQAPRVNHRSTRRR